MCHYCRTCLTYVTHFMYYDLDTIIMIPILQMKKLRPGEVEQFIQSHTASKWQDQLLNQAFRF